MYTGDFTCDGSRFVVAGLDRNLYVYDEVDNAHTFLKEMSSKDMNITAHTNRVNCIRAHPSQANIVFSAGWDNTLKIYDVEKGYPIASIGGTECTSDSIDIKGDMMLTGSYRNHSEMSLLSCVNQKLVFNWDFHRRSHYAENQQSENGFVLGARFSHCGNFIFAGGAGKNELKVWMNNSDTSQSFK